MFVTCADYNDKMYIYIRSRYESSVRFDIEFIWYKKMFLNGKEKKPRFFTSKWCSNECLT